MHAANTYVHKNSAYLTHNNHGNSNSATSIKPLHTNTPNHLIKRARTHINTHTFIQSVVFGAAVCCGPAYNKHTKYSTEWR